MRHKLLSAEYAANQTAWHKDKRVTTVTKGFIDKFGCDIYGQIMEARAVTIANNIIQKMIDSV